jgi:glycosyltransferase involved in cell wall biosynthesis
LRRNVEDLIKALSLQEKVLLLGWRRDIPQILSVSDIVVFTSLWEGMPVAAIEAMSAGKPVIATRTGGVEELVRDNDTGFLIEPRNMEAMSSRLLLLLKDKELCYSMGQKARVFLGGDFTTENMLKNTESVYLALAKERKVAYVN